MDELDETRDVIASYRRARVLGSDARARVHARLVASLAQGDARDDVRRDRPWLTIAVIALATAAGVILAASWLAAPARHATSTPRHDEAVFEHDDAPQPSRARPPAEPPRRDAASIADTDAPAIADTRAPALTDTDVDAPDDTSTPAPPPTNALAAELAHMRAARSALDRGTADEALAHLDAHAREHADGQLVEERRALRVEALCAAGKRPQARAEASLFVRDYPGSTHADRVAAACR